MRTPRVLALVVLLSALLSCRDAGQEASAMPSPPALAEAQSAPSQECAVAACEDDAILRVALQAALGKSTACGAAQVFVLSTLHLAPMTHFADAQAGLRPRYGVPSSPAVVGVEDIASAFFRRQSPKSVTKIDSTAALANQLPAGGCLLTLSPPELRPDGFRVKIGEWRKSPEAVTEFFVFVIREGTSWRVARSEIGIQS